MAEDVIEGEEEGEEERRRNLREEKARWEMKKRSWWANCNEEKAMQGFRSQKAAT